MHSAFYRYVLFFSILLTGWSHAQVNNFTFERVSPQKWLYQRNITAIAQDNQGFIWFGTSNGLYRFDGYTVEEFKYDAHNINSLPHNKINCITASPNGILWIGTWGGLARFDPKNRIFTRFTNQPGQKNSLPLNDIRTISTDLTGNIWIGTFGAGLVKYNPAENTFKQFAHDRNDAGSLSSNFVNTLVIDKNGDIWIGTRKGINKLDVKYERFTQFPGSLEADKLLYSDVTVLCEDATGNIWYGTNGGGLIYLNRNSSNQPAYSGNKLALQKSVSSSTINDIIQDEHGKIWVATPEGINIIDNNSGETIHVQANPNNNNDLISNDIKKLFQDHSGVVWVITAEGINLYSKLSGRFKKFQRTGNNSLLSNKINCFAEDQSGNIWIGTQGGLNRFDRQSKSFHAYRLNPETYEVSVNNDVKSILFDLAGNFWLGTVSGLYKYNVEKGSSQIYKFNPLSPNSLQNEILTLYQTRNGEIWAGLRQGVARFYPDSGKFELFRPDPKIRDNQINNSAYTLLEDRYGKFWVGTLGGGLFEFDRNKGQFKQNINKPSDSLSISHNSVISLYEDRFGFFWVGTFGGGLNRMDRKSGTFTHFSAQSGIQDDMIYSILEDLNGNLWISTNKGLVKFDPRNKTARNYDAFDGLQTNDFNIGAALKTRSMEMLFGGNAGFNIFNPEQILENNFVPPTVITKFKVFDTPVLLNDSAVHLAYNKNYITFEFSSLSYALSDKNQFSYKLTGFDNDWIYSGSRRFASYSNLSPGKYVFQVKSSNSDGLWNEKGITIAIYIERPFWKTWWFILMTSILITLLLYIGYRVRIHNIHRQKVLLEKMVHQRTFELKQASAEAVKARKAAEKASRSKSSFLANMSHEIRTPLNGILGFTDLLIKHNKNAEDKRYLELIRSSGDTLLRLLSDILDLNKIEQGKLTIENIRFNFIDTIQQTLLPYQYRANEKGLQFLMSFDPNIPQTISGDPTRIKQLIINLISNSLKFTETGGISISFQVESIPESSSEYIYIRGTVTDTGIGIAPEKQLLVFDSFTQADGSFTRKYGGSGLGLSIVKQLVHLMGGEIRLISPVPDKPFPSKNPGSSFVFNFKVKAEEDFSSDKKNNNHKNEPGLKFTTPYQILLVEDNKINQLLAVTILENLGLKVSTADDGEQGVIAVKENDFDLVLMDVQMPVMNGYESTAAIRNLGITIPIVGLTANVYKEDIDRCIDAGMNSHLGKPFTEQNLFNELKRWLV